MQKLILIAAAVTLSVNVFGQATVVLNNRVSGGTSHVWGGGTTQIQGDASNDTPFGATSYAGLTLIGMGGGGFGAATTMAQLLGAPGTGQPEMNLYEASSSATTFRTGAAAGNTAFREATFNNIPKDSFGGTFEMVAWDNSSGLYSTWASASVAWKNGLIAAGKSPPFDLNYPMGGDINVSPNIEPALQSFNIYVIPEPASGVLAGLGAAALAFHRRRKR
jgi:PEP-CTERM motif-containing protein